MKQKTKTITAIAKVKKEMHLVEHSQAKQRPLYEFYIGSRLLNEPNFKPDKPWRDVTAETVLKALEAGAFRNGINPHGYELDVADSVTHKEDRLWFYYDGTVYSTNIGRTMGYKADTATQTITMWNKPDGDKATAGFPVGVIKKSGSSAVFVSSGAGKDPKEKDKEEPTEERSTVLDWIQTAIDWLGLIPGIGDILDIINVAISFIRAGLADTESLRKEFIIEGFLSMIAIIPIVGSALALPLKGAFKAGNFLFKLIDKAWTAKKAIKWEKLVESGILKMDDLADLGSGLKWFAGQVKKGGRWFSEVPGIPTSVKDNIIKEIDEFSEWITANGRHVDDLGKMGKANVPLGNKLKPAADQVMDKAASVINQPGFIKRWGNRLTLGVFPRLRKSLFFPEKKLKYIADALQKRFKKKFSDPTMLAGLIKTMPNSKLFTSMNSVIAERISKLPAAEQRALMQQLQSAGAVKRMKGKSYVSSIPDINGDPIRVTPDIPVFHLDSDISTGTLNEVFEILQNNKAGAGMYSEIKDIVFKDAVTDGNSPAWNGFMSDKITNLKTILSTDMIPGGKEIWKSLEINWAKNVDIYWNELTEFREDMNWKNPDDINGVLLPMMQMGLKSVSPGTYDNVKVFRDKINDAGDWVKKSKQAKAVEDMMTDKTQDAYSAGDIGGGTGGKYK